MKKNIFPFLLLFFIACKSGNNTPDVSGIPMNVRVERFDQAFFSADTNHLERSLLAVAGQYPYFINDFAVNILGTSSLSDTSAEAFFACRRFISSYEPVKDSLEIKFQNMKAVETGLSKGFQYVKYYFPKYTLPPKVVSFIGPFDAPGAALTRFTLAIGLQLYAGKDFPFYKSAQGQEMYPLFISRRFEPQYIIPNSMKAIADDLYPDHSQGKPLIEAMIEKGKGWWLVNQFLPETADSLLTGFTQKQLNWCSSNEGQVWNFFLNQDLFSLEPDLIKNFIGDAPNTQGMPDSAPGNTGQWVGWRIVQKYVSQHSGISPEQLLQVPAKVIFDEAKYKPR